MKLTYTLLNPKVRASGGQRCRYYCCRLKKNLSKLCSFASLDPSGAFYQSLYSRCHSLALLAPALCTATYLAPHKCRSSSRQSSAKASKHPTPLPCSHRCGFRKYSSLGLTGSKYRPKTCGNKFHWNPLRLRRRSSLYNFRLPCQGPIRTLRLCLLLCSLFRFCTRCSLILRRTLPHCPRSLLIQCKYPHPDISFTCIELQNSDLDPIYIYPLFPSLSCIPYPCTLYTPASLCSLTHLRCTLTNRLFRFFHFSCRSLAVTSSTRVVCQFPIQ